MFQEKGLGSEHVCYTKGCEKEVVLNVFFASVGTGKANVQDTGLSNLSESLEEGTFPRMEEEHAMELVN